MCLYIKESFVAEKPIIAYKIGKISCGAFLSFYQQAIIPFNRLYKDPEFNKENVLHENYITHRFNGYTWDSKTITNGFLHAYQRLSTATSLKPKRYDGYRIYKVIIPKGSVGFYGRHNDICANQMIILNPEQSNYSEICKEYNLS